MTLEGSIVVLTLSKSCWCRPKMAFTFLNAKVNGYHNEIFTFVKANSIGYHDHGLVYAFVKGTLGCVSRLQWGLHDHRERTPDNI